MIPATSFNQRCFSTKDLSKATNCAEQANKQVLSTQTVHLQHIEHKSPTEQKITDCYHMQEQPNCTHLHNEVHPPQVSLPVDLLLRKAQIDHGSHKHEVWKAELFVEQVAQTITKTAQWSLGEDQEGCPCCIAGLDFDEFAVAIKELNHASASDSETIAQVAEFSDPSHWALFLGIAAPLGLIGLTAAIRNVKGSMTNQKVLSSIIKGLSQDIQNYQNQRKSPENDQIIRRLEAFRDCLSYSKFDADFNLCFPGAVNGVASTLVLSTAVISHPFALPAIALYATGQMARNTFDLGRTWHRHLPITPQDSIDEIQAKEKVNQVHRSKIRFFLANSLGFASFVVGSLLTFISIPALGVAGLGLATLPIGLTLLTLGAASTGVMNNIWPRKFRPRNGDLGIDRFQFKNGKECLHEIHQRRQHKKCLAYFGQGILSTHQWQKRGLKILTALPEPGDFLPRKVARYVERALPFCKYLGTSATKRKHALNKEIVYQAYQSQENTLQLQNRRLATLVQMSGTCMKPIDTSLSEEETLQISWDALKKLKLQAPVLDIFTQENFEVRSLKAQHEPAHKHNENENEQLHTHLKEKSHAHEHGQTSCCTKPNTPLDQMPGMHKTRASHDYTFNFKDFLNQASKSEKQKMSMSMDYYLYFVHRKKMQYQQYGLIDYFWSMNKYNPSTTEHIN